MTTELLERPGGTIAYTVEGREGPLMVAAPGIGDVKEVYRLLSPRLVAAGVRFAALDPRGAGESSVEWEDYSDAATASDMLALATHLGGPAVLVGNSFSAGSAVIAAADSPELVSAIVLIGPFARDVEVPRWQLLAFRALLSPPWGRSAWLWYYRKQLYRSAPPPDLGQYTGRLGRRLKEPGRFEALRRTAFNTHELAGSRLDAVEVPALVIMGTADPDFPDPEGEARFLGSRLRAAIELVEGAGHYPQAEYPEEVAEAILGFLRRHAILPPAGG